MNLEERKMLEEWADERGLSWAEAQEKYVTAVHPENLMKDIINNYCQHYPELEKVIRVVEDFNSVGFTWGAKTMLIKEICNKYK